MSRRSYKGKKTLGCNRVGGSKKNAVVKKLECTNLFCIVRIAFLEPNCNCNHSSLRLPPHRNAAHASSKRKGTAPGSMGSLERCPGRIAPFVGWCRGVAGERSGELLWASFHDLSFSLIFISKHSSNLAFLCPILCPPTRQTTPKTDSVNCRAVSWLSRRGMG